MLHSLFRPALVTLAVLVAGGLVLAQTGGPTLEITGANVSQFPQIILTANVEQAGGQPIDGLTEDDFTVTGALAERCAVADVVNVSEDDITFATVLAIDVSDSMIGTPLDLARAAARLYVESLRPTDAVGVVTFATRVEVLQPVTTDHEAVLAAIDSITNAGQTALYQGTFDAINLAADAAIDRRVVILLSDGAEFGGHSSVTAQDVLGLAGERFITVYTIGLGFGPDRNFLADIAAATGGQYTESPNPDELAGIYTELGRLLSSQYVITLDCDLAADGTEYTLGLQANAGGTTVSDEIVVRAPVPVPVVRLPDLPTQPVDQTVTLTAEVLADDALTNVSFAIDGNIVSEGAEAPFTLEIDPYLFRNGEYTLTVSATDEDGDTGTAEAPLFIAELPILIDTVGLESGGVISEDTRVDFTFVSQSPVNHVAVFIDGVDLAHLVREPWSVTIRPLRLTPGEHTLFIAADAASGEHGELTVPFTISDAPYLTATALAPTATFTPTLTPSSTPTPTPTFTATVNTAATGTAQAEAALAAQLAQAQTGTVQAAETQAAVDADTTAQAVSAAATDAAQASATQRAADAAGTASAQAAQAQAETQAASTSIAGTATRESEATAAAVAEASTAQAATQSAELVALAATSTSQSQAEAQTATTEALVAQIEATETALVQTATADAARAAETASAVQSATARTALAATVSAAESATAEALAFLETATAEALAVATADARATANAISRTQALAATRDALATANAEARAVAQRTTDARATDRAQATVAAATQAVQGTQTANARATALFEVNATGTALAQNLATTTAQAQLTATRAMLETLVVEQQQTIDAGATATAAVIRATGTAQAAVDATSTTAAQNVLNTAVAQQTIGARETINARSGATATAEAMETLAMAQAAVSTVTDEPPEATETEVAQLGTPTPLPTLVPVDASGQSADTSGSATIAVCIGGGLLLIVLLVLFMLRRRRGPAR
jgi:VWFA-related protein